jgi:hypothetical protein
VTPENIIIAGGLAMFFCIVVLSVVPDSKFMRRFYRFVRVPRAIRTYDCIAAIWFRYEPPKANERFRALRFHLAFTTGIVVAGYFSRDWACILLFLAFAMFVELYATFMLKFAEPHLTVFARKA